MNKASLFETDQMATTLERLLDVDRPNADDVRYAATAVGIETGDDIVFDSRERRIAARHVWASAALPVLFPPIEIDGLWFVDGGLSVKLPLDPVLSERPGRPILRVAVDLVPLRQPRPRTLGEVASRAKDLVFGAQSRRTIAGRQAARAGRENGAVTLLRVPYAGQEEEIAARTFDLSAAPVGLRWERGRRAMHAALVRLPDVGPFDRPGLTILDEEANA